jgi:hypothetical protein
MDPFLCARHRAIAGNEEHGWKLCSACFAEAKAIAEAKQLEDRIRALRLNSTSALMQRLGWR